MSLLWIKAVSHLTFHDIQPGDEYDGGMAYAHPHERGLQVNEDGDHERPVGNLRWHKDTGTVTGIEVYDSHQRQGVGRAMWDEAHRRGHVLQHSEDRTEEGDSWAHAVGGHVPPLKRQDW